MNYYRKKPLTIAAFKIDFSNAEKTWETMQNLYRCNHTLIHRNGYHDYIVKLEDTEKEFSHGDYICYDLDNCRWFGRDGHNFEHDWEEV